VYHRVYITSDSGVPAASSSSRGHLRSEPQQQALDREVTPLSAAEAQQFLLNPRGVRGLDFFPDNWLQPRTGGPRAGLVGLSGKKSKPRTGLVEFYGGFQCCQQEGKYFKGE